MTSIHQLLADHLPIKRRTSARGWITCDATCCHHRGHSRDTRNRGNYLFVPDGAIAYNCYNCGFKTVFNGSALSKNFENLMNWMGVPQEAVRTIKMELLQARVDGSVQANGVRDLVFNTEFKDVNLPPDALPLTTVADQEELPEAFMEVLGYLGTRGHAVSEGWEYHWSPSKKHDMYKRVIIPFYQRGRIVGWTARYAGKAPPGTPRYFNSDVQKGYIFNSDVLTKYQRQFVLITEGPFDAIAVDGVAIMGSEISKEQAAWLNAVDKVKVVVPDRQKKNQGLIDAAVQHGWAVAFPDWEDDIKDAADASERYGKLFTLQTIIKSHTRSALEIGVKRRMFK